MTVALRHPLCSNRNWSETSPICTIALKGRSTRSARCLPISHSAAHDKLLTTNAKREKEEASFIPWPLARQVLDFTVKHLSRIAVPVRFSRFTRGPCHFSIENRVVADPWPGPFIGPRDASSTAVYLEIFCERRIWEL